MTHDVENAGERVEELLAILRSGQDREVAEDLVRVLMDLYGNGLARVVTMLREHDAALLGAIAADDLVASLLVLHDLHPDDTCARIRRALAGLGGRFGDIEYLGTDEDGVVRLRLSGGGCGTGGPAAARVAERAVLDAAPEVTAVEITTTAALLQITVGPPPGWSVAS
ncbi:NifU family protein [Lentzea sp. BCCO 10_0856]|uniref:NifU family protein n=1 Tax=Lentzea miocenica TaxID=3095431 RepID=A0ABU4T9U0_9PSEU|nr:NifU family protein [Lentzea sp. BCCO 10_0856]MDX8034924.1 NifU family protein [Lentzea sp. BCCO 10_0856]